MKASNSNQFILEFILSDLNYSKTDEAENWSVVSGAADEGEIENGIQNEIDLLEVEELETPAETEEAEADDLTEPSIEEKPAIEYDYSRLFFFNREVDSGRVLFPSDHGLGFSAVELKLDLFDVLNQSVCQLSKKYDEGDSGYVIPEIPVYTNKKIQAFIHLYTQKKRDVFIKAIERMPLYQEFITKTLVEYELPLNLAYLAVVESNLNPNARSRANAVGLWQFMSYTGKHFGLSNSWWHDDRYDPERSTEAAAKYLKRLHQQFEGNWELAMAAYNSGSGTVRKAIRRAKAQRKSSDFWSLRLPRETRGYVPAFYAVATIFANLEAYGFVPLQPALVTESKQLLDVGGGISLGQLAKVFDLEQERLAEINPRLRFRGLTPPTVESFHVALPLSLEITPDRLEQLESLKKNRHEEWKVHTVKQGETLWSISRRYRIPLETIYDYNRLRKKSLISIGQKLMLPIPTDWNPPKSRSQVQLTAADMDKIPGITKIHVVQKGETLWQISQKYNIPIKTIQYWNQAILNSRYLKIGTEIVLKLPVSYASNSI
jgi:membrane-bound lytic murein transglycosylase D